MVLDDDDDDDEEDLDIPLAARTAAAALTAESAKAPAHPQADVPMNQLSPSVPDTTVVSASSRRRGSARTGVKGDDSGAAASEEAPDSVSRPVRAKRAAPAQAKSPGKGGQPDKTPPKKSGASAHADDRAAVGEPPGAAQTGAASDPAGVPKPAPPAPPGGSAPAHAGAGASPSDDEELVRSTLLAMLAGMEQETFDRMTPKQIRRPGPPAAPHPLPGSYLWPPSNHLSMCRAGNALQAGLARLLAGAGHCSAP
jgi:hypothetical protein